MMDQLPRVVIYSRQIPDKGATLSNPVRSTTEVSNGSGAHHEQTGVHNGR